MVDKVAQFVINLGGDDAELRTLMSGVKSRFKSDVAEMKATADKIDLFGDLKNSIPGVERALQTAKDRVKQFSDELKAIKAAGAEPLKVVKDDLAAAEKAAASATRELAKQQSQFATLGNQLQRAGIDTKNLAAEQQKLSVATKAAADAAALQAAKQQLGLVTVKDTAAEAAKLRAAFDAVKASGTLSANEIVAAQRQLDAKLKELSATVTKTGSSFTGLGSSGTSAFSGIALRATGVVAAAAAASAALNAVTESAKVFENALARVGTVSTLSKGELDGLGGQVRKLSTEIGIDAVAATKTLFDIIRGGVPAGNAFEVLRAGAVAAKASFEDTATGAKAATVLIDAFGLEAREVSGALDIVVKSAQNGGPTLREFAENASGLGNAARAVGADFRDVTALLNVMTSASSDASGSAALLAKALLNFAKPEVRDGLHKLGLDGLSFVDTLRQLSARGYGINEILQLGIAGGKSAVAMSGLVNNIGKLPEASKLAADALGTADATLQKISSTAEEREKRLQSTWEESKRIVGELVGAKSLLASAFTSILQRVNEQVSAFERQIDVEIKLGAQLLKNADEFFKFSGALDGVEDSTVAVTKSVHDLEQELANVSLASVTKIADEIKGAVAKLETNARSLEQLTPVVQKSVADQIAAIRERAQVEVDMLDKSTAKQVETAAKTLEITTQANADIAKVTDEGQKLVSKITDAAIRDRTALERKRIADGKGDEELYLKDISAIRQRALTADLANAQKFQSDLIAQRTATQQRLNAIEQSRIDFNRSINESIQAIAAEGQSGLQQFAEKQKEVDRLIAEARQVAATQGIAAAQQYFEKAKTLSESLRGEVLSDGTVVVSAFEGTQTAVKKLREVQTAYNEESKKARTTEQQGFDDTATKLKKVGDNIDAIQATLVAMRTEASESIKLTIDSDIRGIDAARKQIDELVKPETKIITAIVRTNAEGLAIPEQTPALGRSQGGPIPAWRDFAQRYATGGPVFRRPSWSKVPGSGRGDTVPALLQAGSFVMSNHAVSKYGDGWMSRLARGYNSGGFVSGLIFGALPAGKKTDAEKIAEYVNSLPRAQQQQFKRDIEIGGTAALIAENEAREAIATQARGAPTPIAPGDVSPTPSPEDATAYGRFIESHLKTGGIMALVKQQIGNYINQVNRSPFDQSLIQGLVRSARAAAANNFLESVYGKSAFGGQKSGFANLPDWFEFLAQLKAPGNPLHPGRNRSRGFAQGGSVRDVVPAMLEPGEWIIPKHVAAMLGGGFLNAVNQGRFAFAPPPMPRGFAMGGAVPGAVIPQRGTASVGGVTFGDLHIHAAGGDLKDPRVRRELLADLDDHFRRAGITLARK